MRKYPILAVTGPRQSGKTTMLKTMLPGYRYVNLEDPDLRQYAKEDPRGFLNKYDNKVVFDEVQQSPHLFSYLQSIVDDSGKMGQFILSGSQNFNLMHNITQSLAGRVAIFKLLPFDQSEMTKAKWLSKNLSEVFTNGFYPAIFQRGISPDRYYSDYVNTYVKRDVTQLLNVQNERQFKLFIKLCAARAGSLINFNSLAKDAGISHTTARKWISVLETSYIVYMLQPYYNNYSKRIIKSPKLYFYDVGLLCHLLDIRKGKIDQTHPMWGHIFENMIVSEYQKQNEHKTKFTDFWFWRDSHGNEIDLMYSDGKSLQTIEIKSSSTIQSRMFKGLKKFKEIAKQESLLPQTLIYGGDKNQKRTNFNIKAWSKVEL